ncbi:MAG: beta-ketoacyl-ACP synthase III [Lachnospirales bacterium]
MKVLGVGSYVPGKVLINKDFESIVDTSDEWIVSRTGIEKRHIVVDEKTSDMAIKASKSLLENYNIDPLTIDMVILSTVTPDYLTPATASIVQEAIGAKNAFSFDISSACAGFVSAMSIANSFLSSKINRILVISAETLSKITNFDDRNTCVLFGDGAGCMLVENGGEEFYNNMKTESSKVASLYGHPIKNNSPFSKENITDDEFLHMNGRDVFELVTKLVPLNITELLEDSKINLEDIYKIIPHQANKRLIEALAKKLYNSMENVFVNIQNYGNTSSASIPIAFDDLVKSKNLALGSGEKVLIVGYGAGFTYGSGILTI